MPSAYLWCTVVKRAKGMVGIYVQSRIEHPPACMGTVC